MVIASDYNYGLINNSSVTAQMKKNKSITNGSNKTASKQLPYIQPLDPGNIQYLNPQQMLCNFNPDKDIPYESEDLGTGSVILPNSAATDIWHARGDQTQYVLNNVIDMSSTDLGVTQGGPPTFAKIYDTARVHFNFPSGISIVVVDNLGNESIVTSGNTFDIDLSSIGSGTATLEYSYYARGTGSNSKVIGEISGRFVLVLSGEGNTDPDFFLNIDTVGEEIFIKPNHSGASGKSYTINLYEASAPSTITDSVSYDEFDETGNGYVTFPGGVQRDTLYSTIEVFDTDSVADKSLYSVVYPPGNINNTFFTNSNPYPLTISNVNINGSNIEFDLITGNYLDNEESSLMNALIVAYEKNDIENLFQIEGELTYDICVSLNEYLNRTYSGSLLPNQTIPVQIPLSALDLTNTDNTPVASKDLVLGAYTQDTTGRRSATGLSRFFRIYDPYLEPGVKNNLTPLTSSGNDISTYNDYPDTSLNIYFQLERSSQANEEVFYKIYDFSTTGLSTADLENDNTLLQFFLDNGNLTLSTYSDTSSQSAPPDYNKTVIPFDPAGMYGKDVLILAVTCRDEYRTSDITAFKLNVQSGMIDDYEGNPAGWNSITFSPTSPPAFNRNLNGGGVVNTYVNFDKAPSDEHLVIGAYSKNDIKRDFGLTDTQIENLDQETKRNIVLSGNNILLASYADTAGASRSPGTNYLISLNESGTLNFNDFYDNNDELLLLAYTVTDADDVLNSYVGSHLVNISRSGFDETFLTQNEHTIYTSSGGDAYSCVLDWPSKTITMRYHLSFSGTNTSVIYKVFTRSAFESYISGQAYYEPDSTQYYLAQAENNNTGVMARLGNWLADKLFSEDSPTAVKIAAAIPLSVLGLTSCINPMQDFSSMARETDDDNYQNPSNDPQMPTDTTELNNYQAQLRYVMYEDTSDCLVKRIDTAVPAGSTSATFDSSDGLDLTRFIDQDLVVLWGTTDGNYLTSDLKVLKLLVSETAIDPLDDIPDDVSNEIMGEAATGDIILAHPSIDFNGASAYLIDARTNKVMKTRSSISVTNNTVKVELFDRNDIPYPGLFNVKVVSLSGTEINQTVVVDR